ncbi:elongation of very long chain fatty acids protein-like [Pollicipes pollicipes]|uniref:elongation of very long chain fatty acids protein-like n=1 Tax=Pollicipes pollicipes TaxID=41117 RepID=UPI00188558C0|nr:elongation of very long chain fatty acids protein-like [Pollicipes pollicipes]XP_037088617.1 elongation of very long chain fatty acids protein-like [Pollicipes pollicipes]
MVGLVKTIVDGYNHIMVDLRDPRMDDFPLMSSPFPVLAICLTYVWTVCWLGPRWMKNRPPYDVRRLLVVYNAAQVMLSLLLFYRMLMSGWLFEYSFRCQPVDYSNDPKALYMVTSCWMYFFSKILEFPDTIFFVLRKKFAHVSVLHVVHHGIMPFSVWWGAKFIPGGHSTFFGLANTFVHIFMYAYYMVAAMGPRYQRFIRWKKHMTNLQMVQFVAIMLHSFQLVFRECDYPTIAFWYIGAHGLLFFMLFLGFYRREYYGKKPKKDDDAVSVVNGSAATTNGHNGIKTNGSGVAHQSNDFVKQTNGLAREANGFATPDSNGHMNGYQNGVRARGAASNGVLSH